MFDCTYADTSNPIVQEYLSKGLNVGIPTCLSPIMFPVYLPLHESLIGLLGIRVRSRKAQHSGRPPE